MKIPCEYDPTEALGDDGDEVPCPDCGELIIVGEPHPPGWWCSYCGGTEGMINPENPLCRSCFKQSRLANLHKGFRRRKQA